MKPEHIIHVKNVYDIETNEYNSMFNNNKFLINYIKSKGVKLYYVDLDVNGRLNLKKIFFKAYNFGISTIIVEGGKSLTRAPLHLSKKLLDAASISFV